MKQVIHMSLPSAVLVFRVCCRFWLRKAENRGIIVFLHATLSAPGDDNTFRLH